MMPEMLNRTRKKNPLYTITRDKNGWLLIPKDPPFFSLRYVDEEEMFVVTLIAFKKLPKGFQYSLTKARLALKKAITQANQLKGHTN